MNYIDILKEEINTNYANNLNMIKTEVDTQFTNIKKNMVFQMSSDQELIDQINSYTKYDYYNIINKLKKT